MKPEQLQAPINILLADDDTDDCYFLKEAVIEFSLPTHLTAVHDGEQLMEQLVIYSTSFHNSFCRDF